MSKVTAVIPARMAASRFPGKPLAMILNLPMIEHVRRRVLLSPAVQQVVVATCDQEIIDMVKKFGGMAVMTSDKHERCTDRVEEASQNLETDLIVIVQGDEPLFNPELIQKLIEPFNDSKILCTNLISKINDPQDLNNKDIVKCLINQKNDIMYFSRAAIPHYRVQNDAACYRQTGVSAFRIDFLHTFQKLSPTPLEVAESVDFLRILEHGYPIRSVMITESTYGVDRKEDVGIIEKIIHENKKEADLYQQILKQ